MLTYQQMFVTFALINVDISTLGKGVCMDRFQRLTLKLAKLQKTIQRIKTHQMSALGLKGAHAACVSFLVKHPEGMTATQLCECTELNKAAVSRLLKELEQGEYICYEEGKRYRTKIYLTEQGKRMAESFHERMISAVNAGKNAITENELEQFYNILDRLTENLDGFCQTLDA